MDKVRQSNFEALRLLAMLMVLNLHSFWGYNSGDTLPFKGLDFFRESTSICAVDVFILISGYFGIRYSFKSGFNLFFQIFFYSISIYIVCSLFGIVEFDKSAFVGCFKACYKSWNFVTGYVVLYMFSPLLNAYSDKSSVWALTTFTVALFIFINFINPSTSVQRKF